MPKKQKVDLIIESSDDEEIIIEDDEEEEIEVESGPIRTKELTTKCLEQREHVYKRPGTYIGSVKRLERKDPVWVFKNNQIVQVKPVIVKGVTKTKGVIYVEGLFRIFVEVVSNAIDNVWRSKEFGVVCKNIKIYIDKTTGRTSVWNDGKPILLNFDEEQKKYNPELIFSRLLTSTNYDDDEKRKTSGLNGYGTKLTNIFSLLFEIELFNPTYKQIYKQMWKDNMTKRFDPEIISYSKSFPELGKGSGYTRVSWIPDFKRFDGMTGYDDDILSVYEKYIYDTAMIVSKYNVKVSLNDKVIPVSSFKDYALLYIPESSRQTEEVHMFSSSDSKVIIMPFDRHISVSFANGMCTPNGGVHNESWREAIFRPIVDKINKVKKTDTKAKTKAEKEKEKKKKEKEKKDNYKVDIDDVYKHFAIFIDCEVENPEYESQNKTKLTSPEVEVKIKRTDIPKIMKWSVIEKIKQMLEVRQLADLKVKTRGFTKVEGLDDANFAKKASKKQDCVLCISEGQYVNIGNNSIRIEKLLDYDTDVVTCNEEKNGLTMSIKIKFL